MSNRFTLDKIALPATLLITGGVAGFLHWDYASDVSAAAALSIWTFLRFRAHKTLSPLLLSAWAGWLLGASAGANIWASVLVFPGLILLIRTARDSKSFRAAGIYGFVAGLFCFCIALSWLPGAFSYFTARNAIAGLMLMLPIVALMALKYCAFSVAVYGAKVRKCEWGGLTAAASFVLVEQVVAYIIPLMLGGRLFPFKPLIQVADITGISGVGFLLILFSYQLSLAIDSFKPLVIRRHAAVLATAILVAWAGYGFWRLHEVQADIASASQFTVAAVQANTRGMEAEQSPAKALSIARYIVQSAANLAVGTPKPDLIVFAESTAPMGFQAGHNSIFRDAYKVSAKQSKIPLLADNFGYEPGTDGNADVYRREILLLDGDGDIADVYVKRQLAPIGETLPGETVFPAIRQFFRHGRSFSAGTEPTVFDVAGVKVAPLSCFEILNWNLVRESAANGAQVLVNPSNDAWFRSSKEARQHLLGAAFRAVELRLPLVRVANSGFSAFIDQTGQINTASPLDVEWRKSAAVAVTAMPGAYRKGGYLFPWLCAAILFAAVLRARFLPVG